MTPAASVIIPAHDEATVLPGLLAALTRGGGGRLEIVVVANGCTDATVQVARAAGARVVEIDTPSKIAALNAGDAVASTFPRIYLDADVVVDAPTLLALADALRARPGAAAGAPALEVDTTGASWAVRQHYRVWALTDYRSQGLVGSGIYAVNAPGRARWGQFPDVIADDRFVQQLFAPDERITLTGHTFTVRAPRTLRALVRRGTRIQRGNRQLTELGLGQSTGRTGQRTRAALVQRVVARPSLWPAFAVYCLGYGLPLVRARLDAARRAPVAWNRDTTTRIDVARTGSTGVDTGVDPAATPPRPAPLHDPAVRA